MMRLDIRLYKIHQKKNPSMFVVHYSLYSNLRGGHEMLLCLRINVAHACGTGRAKHF